MIRPATFSFKEACICLCCFATINGKVHLVIHTLKKNLMQPNFYGKVGNELILDNLTLTRL